MAVYAFGSGETGQLGMGETILQALEPMAIPYFKDIDIIDISAGGMHSMALSAEGAIYTWGCNDEFALGREGDEFLPAPVVLDTGRLRGEMKIKKIVCGDSISAAIPAKGMLQAWGTFRNEDGLLGFSRSTRIQKTPKRLRLYFKDVSSGINHLVGVTQRGELCTFGDGKRGQLGRYIPKRSPSLGLIPSVVGKNMEGVGAGSYHTLSFSGNTLFSFGLNNFRQLGHGDDTLSITLPFKIKSIGGGDHFTVILGEGGDLYAVGRNNCGQLGTGDMEDRAEITKCSIGKVKMFDTSPTHVIAVTEDGKVFSWGLGVVGQLGYDEEAQCTPTEIKGDFQGNVLKVSAGAQHSLVLTDG